eukprot:5042141-Pleurochrysis_carterae.AAC.1
MWDIPRDPIGCIPLAANFCVVPVATNVNTIAYMELRAILGCSTGSSYLCNSLWNLFMYIGISSHKTQYIQTMLIVASLHYRSGSISVCGWTMMYTNFIEDEAVIDSCTTRNGGPWSCSSKVMCQGSEAETSDPALSGITRACVRL